MHTCRVSWSIATDRTIIWLPFLTFCISSILLSSNTFPAQINLSPFSGIETVWAMLPFNCFADVSFKKIWILLVRWSAFILSGLKPENLRRTVAIPVAWNALRSANLLINYLMIHQLIKILSYVILFSPFNCIFLQRVHTLSYISFPNLQLCGIPCRQCLRNMYNSQISKSRSNILQIMFKLTNISLSFTVSPS